MLIDYRNYHVRYQPDFPRRTFSHFRTSINSTDSSCSSSVSLPSGTFDFTQFRNWSVSKCEELSARWVGNLSLSPCEKMVGK